MSLTLNYSLRLIKAWLLMLFIATALPSQKNVVAQDIEPPAFTLDFEDGTLRGWESEGRAFANQPTLGDNPTAGQRGQSANLQGSYWIGTYENYQGRPGQQQGAIQGNAPTGVLTSTSFTIPDGTLSFLIGGSNNFATRVELDVLDQIEGRIRVEYATGQGSETMERVEWDLSQFAGSNGQLRIIDESTTGHINVDDFNFSYFQNNFNFQDQVLTPVNPEVLTDNLVQPTVELMVTNNPVKVGGRTIFAALLEPRYDAASYNFHFGNGEESGWSKNPRVSYVYNSSGQYEAFVEVRPNPDLNTIRSKPVPIEVTVPEVDLFLRADKTDVFVDETIQLTGGAANDSLDLIIYYGDDNAGNFEGSTVEYSYSQPGTYTVQLAAYLNDQLLGREAITINVGASSLDLDASDLLTVVDEPVSFTAQLDPSRPDYSYEFNLGDDTNNLSVTSPEIEYRFSTPGRYLVDVVARSANEELSIRSNSLLVTVVEVSLSADKSVLRKGESVRFTGSVNPALDNATYNFAIGDSTFSRSQPEFEHVFRQAGDYEVNFTVSVTGRNVSSDPYSITVRSDLNLGLEPNSNEAATGDAIQFTALGVPPDVTAEYNFHFGDGEESGWTTNAEASHSYDEKGSYNAFVEARLSPNQISQSNPVPIEIGGFPYWILVAAGIVVLGTGGYLLATRSIRGPENGASATGSVTTTVKPHIDPGEQDLAPNSRLGIGTELRLKPVKDIGEQSIEITDNLIKQERKHHESS